MESSYQIEKKDPMKEDMNEDWKPKKEMTTDEITMKENYMDKEDVMEDGNAKNGSLTDNIGNEVKVPGGQED